MKKEQLKKLPIGISTFSKIREENYLYIDKTPMALDLIENYNYSFLSRPRRFGKSLFLDTLKEIFEGNKKLFEGLYIYDKWDWETKYPVIKISFGGSRSTDELKNAILDSLRYNQKKLGIACHTTDDYALCFKQLIEESYNKYKKPVVILIDEYDKPILDNLDQMEVALECREILKRLYTQIKESDRYIKFAFLTGVSKFSKASIFSGLNNLEDISLTPNFGTICGYTQNDIESSFLPYLKNVDLQVVKEWYNGYNFLNNRVYNPFDILLFIKNDFKFENYWFNTGTPSFLIKLFKENDYNLAEFESIEVGKELLESFDIENLSLETIMFQSGYLTIKEVERLGNNVYYHLGYPNIEVKQSFSDYVLSHYFVNRAKKSSIQIALYKRMAKADLEGLETTLKSLFSSIAYNNFTKNEIENYEGFYASVVYAYFAGAGFDRVIAEDAKSEGRIDLSLFMGDKVYIFEFKVDKSGALAQIKEKNYHQAYMSEYNEVYLVGVEFDSKKRNITVYDWERVK